MSVKNDTGTSTEMIVNIELSGVEIGLKLSHKTEITLELIRINQTITFKNNTIYHVGLDLDEVNMNIGGKVRFIMLSDHDNGSVVQIQHNSESKPYIK